MNYQELQPEIERLIRQTSASFFTRYRSISFVNEQDAVENDPELRAHRDLLEKLMIARDELDASVDVNGPLSDETVQFLRSVTAL